MVREQLAEAQKIFESFCTSICSVAVPSGALGTRLSPSPQAGEDGIRCASEASSEAEDVEVRQPAEKQHVRASAMARIKAAKLDVMKLITKAGSTGAAGSLLQVSFVRSPCVQGR